MTDKNTESKIVIIDDEPMILQMYAMKCEQMGLKPFTSTKAEEGLDIIEREKPDMIFLDIIMPEHDGFWLLEIIKTHNDKEISSIPVIMLTNLDDPQTRKRCSVLGCLYYLVKPFHTPSQIGALIKDILAAQKKEKNK